MAGWQNCTKVLPSSHSAFLQSGHFMIISGSFWRKAIVTSVAACGFVWVYEVTILDSKYAARQATRHEANALPAPGQRVAFTAPADCKGIVTTPGLPAPAGGAAGGPRPRPG